VAIENADLNGVSALCRFVESVGLSHPSSRQSAPYDLVVANILAGPLLDLTDTFTHVVRAGGRALLSGLLVEQADTIVSAYRRCGFTLERHIDLETGGAWWRTLLLRR
jgi:ribosomal protein L11 methyltransferase